MNILTSRYPNVCHIQNDFIEPNDVLQQYQLEKQLLVHNTEYLLKSLFNDQIHPK